MEKIDKNRRIVWTNKAFEDWRKSMIEHIEDGESESDFDEEMYAEDCNIWLDDKRVSLNIPIDGYIVCFADLDLWDGHHNGAKLVGNNVRDILSSSNGDYVTWFCDRYNARCEDTHHDGTNRYLYRLAKSREQAEKLVDKIAYEGMSEEEFRKATRSVRPFFAKTYGW